MSNETASKTPKATTEAPREGIRVAKLLVVSPNPAGVRVPVAGRNGGSDHFAHSIEAGINGNWKTEIEFRPWMRHHRVTRFEKTSRTQGKEEVIEWKPSGEFFIHETLVVWSPVGE